MPHRVCLAALACLVCGCASRPPATQPARLIRPFEGVAIRKDAREVQVEAKVCLDDGWLEQIACSPNTREHEALVVVRARPSDVHAALLLAGYKHGAPGSWSYDGEILRLEPPTGDRLAVLVRYVRDGATVEEPIGAWIVDAEGRQQFPEDPWIFGGSALAPNPDWMGPGEHYVADVTGSVIGLVTFGDELLGFSRVLADQEAVQPPEWKVNTDYVPTVSTPVTVILRPADD